MEGDRPPDIPIRSCSTLNFGVAMVDGQKAAGSLEMQQLDDKIKVARLQLVGDFSDPALPNHCVGLQPLQIVLRQPPWNLRRCRTRWGSTVGL